MRTRYAACLAMIVMLLSACGRSDAIDMASSTQLPATSQTDRADIAQLLKNPSASGTSVEIGAYVWRAWSDGEGSSWADHDAQGCPILNGATNLLTDQPTPWMLSLLNLRVSNFSSDYPPDSAPWLVMNGNEPIPYHARIRGHMGDPSVGKCSFAKHIFTFERVVATYEQDPPAMREMQVPDTFSSWKRYHDADLGYSFLYPSGWNVEKIPGSGLVAEISVRNPQNPNYPMLIRIHKGETYADPYNTAHTPPLLNFGGGIFGQDRIPIHDQVKTQHLAGYYVRYDPPDNHSQQVGVFFNSAERTYELFLRYPIGMDASQDLTTAYTFFVLGFQFDVPPGPTPTPPIKQQLGKGPFLSQEQVLALLRQKYGAKATLLHSALISEAEARGTFKTCNNFQGHPEGVWLLTIHGIAEEMLSTIQLDVDASTGVELCSEINPDPDAPTPLPKRINPTPIPGTTPTPFSISDTLPAVVASPYPAP